MTRQAKRPAGLVIGEYEQNVGLLGGPSDYRESQQEENARHEG